jgi:hypothetical protein
MVNGFTRFSFASSLSHHKYHIYFEIQTIINVKKLLRISYFAETLIHIEFQRIRNFKKTLKKGKKREKIGKNRHPYIDNILLN